MDWITIFAGILLVTLILVINPEPVYASIFDDIANFFQSLFDEVMDFINRTGEIIVINQLYNDFPDVKARNNPSEKLEFNHKVNSLESWKQYCTGTFNIDNFNYDTLSYDKLAEQYCPPLQDKTIEEIKEIFGR